MKRTSFSLYCCLAETKNIFMICFFFFFFFWLSKTNFEHKNTEIHAACHTYDNLWTFLTVYQQREKNLAKNKRICAYIGL